MTEQRPSGPRAATRVLDLLMMLAGREGMTLTELSTEMAVPKSTLVATLRGLADRRYLTHEHGQYRLGAYAYRLASRIVNTWSAPEMIRIEVKALARQTGESVGFAIADWELGQAIYTEAVNSRQPVRYAMQAGLRAPLYASAAGRVLLAYSSPYRVDDYLARANLRRLTDRTRADKGAIRRNLEEIRAQGFCASFGEMLPDTAALAVPVLRPDGRSIGAMMLAAPLARMRSNYEHLLDAIVRAGRHVSADDVGMAAEISDAGPALHQMADDSPPRRHGDAARLTSAPNLAD